MFKQPSAAINVPPHFCNVGTIITGPILHRVVHAVLVAEVFQERQITSPRRLVIWRVPLRIAVLGCGLVYYAERMEVPCEGYHSRSVLNIEISPSLISHNPTATRCIVPHPPLLWNQANPVHQTAIETVPFVNYVSSILLYKVLHYWQMVLPNRQLQWRNFSPPTLRVGIGSILLYQ